MVSRYDDPVLVRGDVLLTQFPFTEFLDFRFFLKRAWLSLSGACLACPDVFFVGLVRSLRRELVLPADHFDKRQVKARSWRYRP